MKVLLINPPRRVLQRADFPPPAIMYLAAALKRAGREAYSFDASLSSWKKVRRLLMNYRPDMVCISCWTVNRAQAFKAACLVKETLPDARIIIGGYHATAFPGHMFIRAYADAVIMGEGEETIVELADAFEKGRPLCAVKGIAFLEGGDLKMTGPRPLIDDLDSIPFPDYTDIDLNNYLGLPENSQRAASIITSRGCPHRCSFCSSSVFWRRRWRPRSAENVIEEIKWLYREHGVRALIFFDDNFTVDAKRAISICRGILREGLDIKWTASSHVNHVTKELLLWMKKAGCYRIDFGVESGSPRILKEIDKRETVGKIKEAFGLSHSVGILPRPYLLVGSPGEDRSTIEETLGLMREIKPFAAAATLLKVLPDTGIYQLAKKRGIVDDAFWLNNDSELLYTAEHTVKELYRLRDILMKGLACSANTFRATAEYLARSLYHRFSVLQKFRGIKRIFYNMEFQKRNSKA